MFTVKENNLCLSFNRKLSNYLKEKTQYNYMVHSRTCLLFPTLSSAFPK